jgi:hypothetical protein
MLNNSISSKSLFYDLIWLVEYIVIVFLLIKNYLHELRILGLSGIQIQI